MKHPSCSDCKEPITSEKKSCYECNSVMCKDCWELYGGLCGICLDEFEEDSNGEDDSW